MRIESQLWRWIVVRSSKIPKTRKENQILPIELETVPSFQQIISVMQMIKPYEKTPTVPIISFSRILTDFNYHIDIVRNISGIEPENALLLRYFDNSLDFGLPLSPDLVCLRLLLILTLAATIHCKDLVLVFRFTGKLKRRKPRYPEM
jgi:hypothetical protein